MTKTDAEAVERAMVWLAGQLDHIPSGFFTTTVKSVEATHAATVIADLVAQRDALQAENNALTTCGIAEVAAHSPSVMDYMKHWEGRAEKAEAQVDALTAGRVKPLAEAMQDLLREGRGAVPESADAFYDSHLGEFTADRILALLKQEPTT